MVHGRQPADQKEQNMKRFVNGDTQIYGVNHRDRSGSECSECQCDGDRKRRKIWSFTIHQLRGRVGRGAEKSYCILLSGSKLGNDARERIKIMTATNNGFEIAEKDLELRGPGDIEGTRQSGCLNFKLANIVQDRPLLEIARSLVIDIIENDPDLVSAENLRLKNFLQQQKGKIAWSKIS